MKAVFLGVAIASCVAAVLFAFWGNYERAFVAATVGAVGWLLHFRQTLKEKLPKEEEHLDEEESDEEVRS